MDYTSFIMIFIAISWNYRYVRVCALCHFLPSSINSNQNSSEGNSEEVTWDQDMQLQMEDKYMSIEGALHILMENIKTYTVSDIL